MTTQALELLNEARATLEIASCERQDALRYLNEARVIVGRADRLLWTTFGVGFVMGGSVFWFIAAVFS